MAKVPQSCRSIDEAVDRIVEAVQNLSSPSRPIIGITGAVGSGKSTLASRLGGTIVSTDNYLPDYARISPARRDEPAEADLHGLLANLKQLKETGRSVLPVWCFHEHRRIGEREVHAEGQVVCEGLFALHPHLASAVDLRVLVRAPAPDRWSRWARLERDNERGWGVERAREHFDHVADPTFERYLPDYMAGLDFLVDNATQDQP